MCQIFKIRLNKGNNIEWEGINVAGLFLSICIKLRIDKITPILGELSRSRY